MPIIAESALWERARAALSAGDPPAGSATVTGPAPGCGGRQRPLDEVLVARRSVRSFARTPVGSLELRHIVDTARAADARMWSGLAVPGSTPAVMLSTRDDDLHELLAAQYVEAPLLLLVLADVAAATAHSGGVGYRQCLLRASGFGYAAWLAALAVDLGGSVYGRSSPQVTAALRSRHRTTRRHLFTVALGVPA